MNEKKIYRRFINSDSDELWIKYDGQDFYELFNEVMPFKAYLKYFENKKFKTVKNILFDAKGIYLNVNYQKFPEKNWSKGKLKINDSDKKSKDGLVYKIFEEKNQKNPRAVFLFGKKNDEEIIKKGKIDEIRNYLIDEYIQNKGINFKTIPIEEKLKNFSVNKKYFK